MAYSAITVGGREPFSHYLPTKSLTPTFKGVGFIAAVLLIVMIVSLRDAISEVLPHTADSLPIALLADDASVPFTFLYLLTFAIFPALTYGLFFCGALVEYLRPFGKGIAVFLPALLFTICQSSLYFMPFTFLLGILLSTMTLYGKNVLYTISLQALISTATLFLFTLDWSAPTPIALLAAVVLIVLIIFLFFHANKSTPLLTISQRIGILFSSPTLMAGILLGVVSLGMLFL